MSVDEMISFVKNKNCNSRLDKKYFEINEENLPNYYKQIITIFKKLVSEFR